MHILKDKKDNFTAVSAINHMGTSHSDTCHALTKEIWEWCIPRGIRISTAHIPGKENTVAVNESQQTLENAEWRLDPKSLQTALDDLQFYPETLNFYAFPPFSIIPAELKKIQTDNSKGEGICALTN